MTLSDHVALNGRLMSNDEVESIWKEVAVIKVLSQDLPGGFDKNKSLGQDSQCPNQGSKRTPSR